MKNDYIDRSDDIFFKHEISVSPSRNIYSMHTHGMYEVLYFLNGDATYVIEDRKYKLKKNDLILIRPFHYHFIQIDSPARYERYDILFDEQKHRIENLHLIDEKTEVINLSDNVLADGVLKRCDLYREKSSKADFAKLLRHLLSELFYSLSLFPQHASESDASVSPLILGALEYINDHLTSLSGVSEIAHALFVSESYLFRRFKAELHQTPRRYIAEKRILLADRRISEGEKPLSVSQSLGFNDYTTFYRSYVSYFGRSPAEKAGTYVKNN